MANLDFEDWYRSERPRVVAAVTAITGRPSIAAEVTDEAFTRAVEHWRRVRAMESPGGWVHRTALNVARRTLRRSDHERRLLRSVARTVPGEAAPPDWPLELWDVLDSLPARQREAMSLHHVADLPVAEVAKIMGVTTGTVSATLHAARANAAIQLPLGERTEFEPRDGRPEPYHACPSSSTSAHPETDRNA